VIVTGRATADVARVLLAAAWGALLATPLLIRSRRSCVSGRLVTANPAVDAPITAVAGPLSRVVRALRRRGACAAGPLTRVLRALHERRRVRAAERALQRELPAVLDLLAVAVGAGCTPYQAVEVAARWAPPAIGARFDAVMRACELGARFDAALARAVRDAPPLRPVADALLASDRLGAPVAPALNRLAAEERAALRRRADAHARRVPVRLLFPLVFLVLPAFVLLTLVPGLASGLARL
jgi:pilus assembly protein TadC